MVTYIVDGYFLWFNLYAYSLTDVDECLTRDRGGCEQNCVNLQGSYECSCMQGYILSSDDVSCNGEPLQAPQFDARIL